VGWRRGAETIECFRFADGYVATVEYADRSVTWQLTAGPAPLAGALFTVALYIQRSVTPQIDPDGRMFIALGEDGPKQVFEAFPDDSFEYVYVDVFRTLEELPDCVDSTDFEPVFRQLSSGSPPELPSGS
jgi:hypothetical protein